MANRLEAVDRYLANARPFAQPILEHLRAAIHRAVPDIQEQIKWSRPFFVYRGVILGNVSAFKEHCSFGLWGIETAGVLRADGVPAKEGMGTFGRLTALSDLPPTAELESYIRRAAELIDSGARTHSIQRVAKPPRIAAEMPAALASALARDPETSARFRQLSPSCRREYEEWIGGAKRAETQARRVAIAVECIAAGKGLNWRYQQQA